MQPIVDARAQPSKKKVLWEVAGVAGLALIVVLSMFAGLDTIRSFVSRLLKLR